MEAFILYLVLQFTFKNSHILNFNKYLSKNNKNILTFNHNGSIIHTSTYYMQVQDGRIL